MSSATRNCQSCKQDFVIAPEDFEFYKYIEVPPPTFCPDCRLQRRLSFYNLTRLYWRVCDLCKKNKISMYPPEAPYRVYCARCWWSDGWDPREYARDYDFSRPFFKQFSDLFHEAPLLGLSLGLEAIDTSPHSNHAGNIKNCYLVFQASESEDCLYDFSIINSRMVLNSASISNCELSHDLRNNYKCNRAVGCENGDEYISCVFITDSESCQDCFASANLYKKKHYIFNKPYTKEGYEKEVAKWDLGSYRTYQELKKKAQTHWRTMPLRPYWDNFSVDSTGNFVYDSKNCKECYEVNGAEDSKYLFMMMRGPIKNCYDLSSWGMNQELCYECCVVGENASRVKFSQEAGLDLYDTEYTKLALGASYQFGCVSLKRKQYAVLNKQYSKEEYEKLVPKIKKHMDEMPYTDKKGRVYKYGEFFPTEISPFPYNETIAQKFAPLTKEEVSAEGWQWRDPSQTKHKTTMSAVDLPNHIKDAPENIGEEAIGCMTCSRPYKIVPMELEFLKKMNLPLPRRCPFCRIDEKIDIWIKNMRLTDRSCDKCNKTFRTPYTKEDLKDILCKECYLREYV